MDHRHNTWRILIPIFLCSLLAVGCGRLFTPIVVKEVTMLGTQQTADVTNVSRDGGYSVLINGHVLWLYDDTECMDLDGSLLSFVANTAAYASRPHQDVLALADFGVVTLGRDRLGRERTAIVADSTAGTQGWIPFQPDELDFNTKMNGKQRVAICTFLHTSIGKNSLNRVADMETL